MEKFSKGKGKGILFNVGGQTGCLKLHKKFKGKVGHICHQSRGLALVFFTKRVLKTKGEREKKCKGGEER